MEILSISFESARRTLQVGTSSLRSSHRAKYLSPGGAFGARNVPAVMKAIEILGIETGRKWNMATLNEVRLFFKLKPYATFRRFYESLIS